MNPLVSSANLTLSILTVIAQIAFAAGIFIFFAEKRSPDKSSIYRLFEKNALLISFLLALTALLGSLFYSEIAGFTPCKFCWFQRIFMYPLTILLLIALIRKDIKIWLYVLPLSLIGVFIALNHYILQITGISIVPCSAVGQTVSCSKVVVKTFGYITIPMMSLSAFLLITLLMIYVRRKDKASPSL